jgi:hypothetical protein
MVGAKLETFYSSSRHLLQIKKLTTVLIDLHFYGCDDPAPEIGRFFLKFGNWRW